MSYVVKPVYFVADGETVKRLYLIYDTNTPKHERVNDSTVLVPSYAIPSGGSVINELTRHFERKGVARPEWRVTPPVMAPVEELGAYMGSAEVLDPVTLKVVHSA